MKVLSVVGNRPQFIKSGPVSVALRDAGLDEVVLHTGQHWDAEMSAVFFEELGLPEPAYRLDLRTADAAAMEPAIRGAVEAERPDWVLVYGDTNSTLAGAEAAGRGRGRARRGRACGAATSRCRRSGTGSPSTAWPSCSCRRTSVPPRSSAREGVARADRGRRRRDGRRVLPVRADRTRALADPGAARPRAAGVRRRDDPPRGERAAGAARAHPRRHRPRRRAGRLSRRTRARGRCSATCRRTSGSSSRSATSTWRRSPRRRA